MGRDPDLFAIWDSKQTGKNQYNFVSYKNPEVDRLWEEGRREYDVGRRKKIYWRVHELMAEDQPYTFLFSPLGISALQKKFVLVEETPPGQKTYKPIKIEKAGLTYDLIKWYVPKETVLEK